MHCVIWKPSKITLHCYRKHRRNFSITRNKLLRSWITLRLWHRQTNRNTLSPAIIFCGGRSTFPLSCTNRFIFQCPWLKKNTRRTKGEGWHDGSGGRQTLKQCDKRARYTRALRSAASSSCPSPPVSFIPTENADRNIYIIPSKFMSKLWLRLSGRISEMLGIAPLALRRHAVKTRDVAWG